MKLALDASPRRLARASLVLLWLGTAAVSLIELQGQSLALLRQAGTPAGWQQPLVLAGAALDALLGLALWRWHRRIVYRAAGLAMLLMTALASLMLPALWLDPLGCLGKNLAISALLLILHEDAPR